MKEPKLFITFERPRDETFGPVFGPFNGVHQTYESLRAWPPVNDDTLPPGCIAQWNEKAGEWFIVEGMPHAGEFYSDFYIFEGLPGDVDESDHDCAAGKVTMNFTDDADLEMRWEDGWVRTGRRWSMATGTWVWEDTNGTDEPANGRTVGT